MKRVEEVIIKYMRNRFMKMELWVEDKMTESDRIREEKDKVREKAIMETMDKMEKRIDRLEKKVGEIKEGDNRNKRRGRTGRG